MTQASAQSEDSPVLSIHALGVTFNRTIHAVSDLSTEISGDDFVVVLGPSGAGKSTFLRAMNRLNSPTTGRIVFHGDDVTHASGRTLRRLRQNVGMIFQQFNLVGRRSVLQNVLAGRLSFSGGPVRRVLSWVGLFRRADQEIAFQALQRVGIEEKAYARADELSGGQQQRVAIARLIAQQPAVILADEPIASLDPASAESVMRLLRDLQDNDGIPVVVNLHQVDVARRFAKRIIGMNTGRVVFDGPPEALDDEAVAAIYAGKRQELEDAGTRQPSSAQPSNKPALASATHQP
jgi:phosphonate transport system ATP-binding protein